MKHRTWFNHTFGQLPPYIIIGIFEEMPDRNNKASPRWLAGSLQLNYQSSRRWSAILWKKKWFCLGNTNVLAIHQDMIQFIPGKQYILPLSSPSPKWLWHGVSDMTLSAEAVAVQQLSQPPPRPFTKHWLKDFTIYPFKNQEACTRNLLQSMSLRISLCMSYFKSGLNAMISVDILANTQLWFLSYDIRLSLLCVQSETGIWMDMAYGIWTSEIQWCIIIFPVEAIMMWF